MGQNVIIDHSIIHFSATRLKNCDIDISILGPPNFLRCTLNSFFQYPRSCGFEINHGSWLHFVLDCAVYFVNVQERIQNHFSCLNFRVKFTNYNMIQAEFSYTNIRLRPEVGVKSPLKIFCKFQEFTKLPLTCVDIIFEPLTRRAIGSFDRSCRSSQVAPFALIWFSIDRNESVKTWPG